MTDDEKWAIVPVYEGKPPSDAIFWGNIGEVTEYIVQSTARAEAEERIASAREQLTNDAKALAQAQQITAKAIPRITAMADAFVSAHEQKARRDAAAKRAKAEADEQRRIQTMLDKLPDPDAPTDDGELEIKRAPETEHLQPTDGITGSFPTRLENEAPRGGEYLETDIKKLAYSQKPQQQPVAISLNEV